MMVLGLETILRGAEPTFLTHIQFIYTAALFCMLPTQLHFVEEKPGNMREIVVNNQSERSSLCTIDMLELKIAPEDKKEKPKPQTKPPLTNSKNIVCF